MAKGISGIGVAFAAAGGVLIYSGIQNQSLGNILGDLVKGEKPTPGAPETYATAATDTSDTSDSSSPTAGIPSPSAEDATASANQAIGRLLAATYGWSTGSQWAALVALWNRESGWNNLAKNPSSGAYGIPQALPASKMGTLANPPINSATAQISWGLSYIKSHPGYGSPVAAWNHEEAEGWY